MSYTLKLYLQDRTQYVKILNWVSKANSGVPQGSHLGPLLFLLFVNDIPSNFYYSSCLLFAYDLKIYKSIKTVLDATQLPRDVDNLSTWCEINCMDWTLI